MENAEAIKEAARHLDEMLEAKDVESVVNCFAEDCEVELLGVRLEGREGVRRWLAWLFGHVETIRFEPRVITVQEEDFVEEFVVRATVHGGSQVRSRQAEVLTFRNGLVTSLRLYFNPLDFAPATCIGAQIPSQLFTRFLRKGLRPYEEFV